MKANPGRLSFALFVSVVSLAGERCVSQASSATILAQEPKSGEPLLRTFKGHTKQVTDVVFSPDGKRLASSSHDGTVRIWDAASGAELLTLKGHRNFVESVAFSPDGKWLASGGWDASVRLWDATSGQEVRKLMAGDADNDSVRSVAFSPDGKKLIAVGMLAPAGDNEPILIWDVATGTRESKLDSQVTNGLFSVAFSRDGKLFATAGYVGGIRVWDSATGRVVKSLRWKGDEMFGVSQVVFSRDGKLVASAGDDRLIRLWDVAAGREMQHLVDHAGTKGKGIERGQIVTSVAFSPDAKLLASSAANEGAVRLWDIATSRQVGTIQAHTGTVARVAFHPDGKQLATAGADGAVKLWDMTWIRVGQKGR